VSVSVGATYASLTRRGPRRVSAAVVFPRASHDS
jgi:hypothetical protein